jgi:hypothetical protein
VLFDEERPPLRHSFGLFGDEREDEGGRRFNFDGLFDLGHGG